MRRPEKKKKNEVSMMEYLPRELVCEVLCKVAANSLTDILNVKFSSKKLKEIGEDKYIYRHLSLEEIPIVQWKRANKDQKNFLNKCLESGNPEIIYRQAVVDYFNKTNLRSAYEKLDEAVKLGHLGAYYVTCIVLLLSGVDEDKWKGVKLLANMKKSTVRLCRTNLVNQLKRMWVNNPALGEPPVFCTKQHLHQRKNKWDEEEEDEKCKACGADREIKFIRATYTT